MKSTFWMSATKIKVQRDNCAFDWCVYPVVNDPTLGEERCRMNLLRCEAAINPLGSQIR